MPDPDRLTPRQGWNPIRRCWEYGRVRIYPADGEFVVSLDGVWLLGTCATLEAAERAAQDEEDADA